MQKYDYKKFTITNLVLWICVATWSIAVIFPSINNFYNKFFTFNTSSSVIDEILSKPWCSLTAAFLHCPLIDPAHGFLLMGILHIFFNMMFLIDIGKKIEDRESKRFYIGFILSAAIITNLIQYVALNNGSVGFSGVLCAMFGFCLIHTKLNKRYNLERGMILGIFIWLGVCLLLPGIANYAHISGLIYGMIVGYCLYRIINYRKSKENYSFIDEDVLLKIKKKRMSNLD